MNLSVAVQAPWFTFYWCGQQSKEDLQAPDKIEYKVTSMFSAILFYSSRPTSLSAHLCDELPSLSQFLLILSVRACDASPSRICLSTTWPRCPVQARTLPRAMQPCWWEGTVQSVEHTCAIAVFHAFLTCPYYFAHLHNPLPWKPETRSGTQSRTPGIRFC